ncbi:alpha/beta-hydrolase [Exidia glandulosa HHB12029]|uniref:Alpha/beta-hydrolase n=1 Tax=Exidia glandulosa HHB12029 TaxID=1314781 RepID=A0A165DZ30_EXIGL|nr:alpha/beta-hydrolase [Exidia glandulosa HHB12029]
MAFAFRSQPLKTLYLVYVVLSVPFIRFPYWVAVSLLPSWRPRREWSLARAVSVRLLRTILHVTFDTDLSPKPHTPEQNSKIADQLGFVWIEPVPDDLVVGKVREAAKVNDVKPVRISGYWFGKRNSEGGFGHKAAPNERIIYALHGGGYIAASAEPASPHTNIVNHVLAHSGGLVERIFALEYRLSSSAPFTPANPFPAALLDAVAGYRYLVHDLGFKPGNIVIEGDSVGAHLALNLVMYLVEAQLPDLSLPRGLILLSPAADWSDSHHADPASSMVRHRTVDYIDIFWSTGYTGRSLCGSLPSSELRTNAYISPASLAIEEPAGLFRGFPPTCVCVGDAELLLDVSRTIRERLVTAIGPQNVTHHEYQDTVHDWLFMPLDAHGRKSLEDIQDWVVNLWREDL